MPSFTRELVTLDHERLDLRAGVLGVAVLGVLALAISVFGTVAMAAVIGALVAVATDPPPAGRALLGALLPLVVGGAVLTFVAVSIGDRTVLATLLAGAVGVAAVLHGGRSEKAAARSVIATMWVVLAFTLHDTGEAPVEYAAAFAVGGAAGVAAAWARARSATADDLGGDDLEHAPSSATRPPLAALARSAEGRYAVLHGIGLAVAVLIGFTWFPEHPAWIAITSIIVVRVPAQRAFVVGAQRALGTGIGVLMAVLLAEAIGDNTPGVVVLFLASAFLMMTFREVNYVLFATLVTALVVYSQRILGADVAEAGQDRLVETILGVVIAFAVLGLADAFARREGPVA